MTPTRLTLSRKKGFRLKEGAVNCARPNFWGNPIRWKKPTDKRIAVEIYGNTILTLMVKKSCEDHEFLGEAAKLSKRGSIYDHWQNLHKLRGKDLACWCKPDEPCHADFLLWIANSPLIGEGK